MFTNKRESLGLKHCKDRKDVVEDSHDKDNIHENIDECNPNKKRKMFILFDANTIVHGLSNNQLHPIVIELFIRRRKRNIPLVLIKQSCYTTKIFA